MGHWPGHLCLLLLFDQLHSQSIDQMLRLESRSKDIWRYWCIYLWHAWTCIHFDSFPDRTHHVQVNDIDFLFSHHSLQRP